jgi:hypothetical protein
MALAPKMPMPGMVAIKGPGLRRQQQGIVRRVDLNIGGAEAKELRDLITEDCDDVGEEVLEACMRGLGTFRRPEIHQQAGAGQGYLCDAACAAAVGLEGQNTEHGNLLVNLLGEEHSRADKNGRHRLVIEAYGYRWFRVGGLDYLLRRSDIDQPTKQSKT